MPAKCQELCIQHHSIASQKVEIFQMRCCLVWLIVTEILKEPALSLRQSAYFHSNDAASGQRTTVVQAGNGIRVERGGMKIH